jgi:prolyl 4-hydroxylase
VIGHDGKAHNVTMEPGDLVLYESHSIIHGEFMDGSRRVIVTPHDIVTQDVLISSLLAGRPFPLKGKFMANVFVHFEPVGPLEGELEYGKTDLPPYLIPGSPEEEHWRRSHPNGHKVSHC